MAAFVVLSLLLSGATIFSLTRTALRETIDQELGNTSRAIVNMVRAAVDVSVRNRLRAVAEKNLENVQGLYREYERGLISEEEAKARATRILLSQTIGLTGYNFCLDSTGHIAVHPHPKMVGRDVSDVPLSSRQIRQKIGYIEYEWANPGEKAARKKALYMTYFEPWDWIISASSYREEFRTLVNADDFRDKVSELRLGKTGYVFIVDMEGRVVVHPWAIGDVQVYSKMFDGDFLKKIYASRQGRLEYDLIEPGRESSRRKIAIFEHLPEMGWVVAASMYADEVNKPADLVVVVITLAVVASIVLSVPLIIMLGGSVTRPVGRLVGLFDRAAGGELQVRCSAEAPDELGILAERFNGFMTQLEASNAETERFIYTVSHDLRSPLITILGFLGMLNQACENKNHEEVRHASMRIESAAQHMLRLLDELLVLSRVGRQDNPRTEMDLNALLLEVLELLDGPIRNAGASVEIGELGRATIDHKRMLEVYQNLIENSIKYAEGREGPRIVVGRRMEHGRPVYFVQDNGRGIAEEYKERIFGLFEQLDQNEEGTGVGLALVKRIVEAHGGRIWVESEGPGRGATFCFTLGVADGGDAIPR